MTTRSVDNVIYTDLIRATTAPNCNSICRNYTSRFKVQGTPKMKLFDRKSLLLRSSIFASLTIRSQSPARMHAA